MTGTVIPFTPRHVPDNTSDGAPPTPLPWSLDKVGDPANGMVTIDATIPAAAFNSLLLLLQNPGRRVVESNGVLALDEVTT